MASSSSSLSDTREAHVRWEPQGEGMMRMEASFPQYETKVIEPVGAKKHVKVVGGGV